MRHPVYTAKFFASPSCSVYERIKGSISGLLPTCLDANSLRSRMKPEDVEKAHSTPSFESVAQFELNKSASNSSSDATVVEKLEIQPPQSMFQRCLAGLKGMESRGIEPVPLEKREEVTPSTSLHMMLMWFSMTLATNNIVVGSMGTLVLGLSFKDAALCAIFGCIVGTSTIGYMSTWGPRSGNRTLVCGSVICVCKIEY